MADAPIVTFRDLDAWKVAMELAVVAYDLSKRLPPSERFELSAQIRRAAVSIPANVAEGQSCGKDGRYLAHVSIAQGSLGELETHFELSRRLRFLGDDDLKAVEQVLARTGQLLNGLGRSLRKRRLACLKGATRLALLCGLLFCARFLAVLGERLLVLFLP
jgi:four helix bundle protein